MQKINWHKVATREFSFLWGSYTASVYQIMKKYTGTEVRYNLYHTVGRSFTVYRYDKDVERSYKLINDLAGKNPKRIISHMDKLEDLAAKNYELYSQLKKTSKKSELKKLLLQLDKIFLDSVMYYLFIVFLGYGGHLPASKKFIKKHLSRFEKLRMLTIDIDMHNNFPKLFGKYDKRFKKHILYMTRQEIIRVLKGQPVDWRRIKGRHKEALVITKNNSTHEYPYSRIKAVLDSELSHLKIDKNTRNIKGQVACRGKVSGRAVKVFKPADYKKIRAGDILVTTMTKPDIVPYLKKVKGIVTNDGGSLSHASIISREMKIPCIVGTMHATDIIQDGEGLILDANQGKIIRNLKN